MILALIGLAVLAIVIFAFVLEPVLRGRADQVELDAAAFEPILPRPTGDDALLLDPAGEPEPERAPNERDIENRPAATVDRRAVGDLS